MSTLPALPPLAALPASPVQPGHGPEVAKKASAAAPAGTARAGDDDDVGGFAAALDGARARVDDREASRTAAQSAPTDGDETGAPDSTAMPAPADAAPTPEPAQWLPGWPPAMPVAATPVDSDIAAAAGAADAGAATLLPSALPAGPPAAALTASDGPAAPEASDGPAAPEAGASGTAPTPAAPLRADRQLPAGTRGPAHATALDATGIRAFAQAGETTQRAAVTADVGAATQTAPARPTDAASGAGPWAALTGLAPREAGRPDGAAAAVASPFEGHLAAALDSPAFAPALANQVKWLLREGVQHAQLSLNPAEMGPLTVHIALDGTQARVDFSADIAATRSTIETSLPTLAAALNASGLTLAGGGVFDGQARHGAAAGRDAATPRGRGNAAANAAGADATERVAPRRPRGLVDLVA